MMSSSNIQIFNESPCDFQVKVHVVSVYLTVGSQVLFLQRSGSEREHWGVPAGKVESGESLDVAVKRELLEETGIHCDTMTPIKSLYMRKPEIDYVYHMYAARLEQLPDVKLSEEHLDYGWFSVEEVRALPLMAGALDAFEYFLKVSTTP